MPLFPLLYYILFGAALFGGGGALLQIVPPPTSELRDHTPDKQANRKPETEPAQKNATEQAAEPQQVNAPTAPSFDVVRIEKNGDGVIAGRAEPGWTVIVEADEKEVARSEVARDGEWAVVLEKPLDAGEHSIGLRALSPGAARGLASEQKVAISVAGADKKEQTVVALSEPGQPTRILTPKESGAPETAEKAEKPAQVQSPGETKPNAGAGATSGAETGATTGANTGNARPSPAPEADTAAKREPAPALSPEPEVAVSFNAVDYEVGDKGEGKLYLSGEAAPGTRVNIYLDNKRVGNAVAGPDGAWTFVSQRKLPQEQQHMMRADAVQKDGQVSSRAEVGFTPPAPKPETQVAAKQPEAPAKPEIMQKPALMQDRKGESKVAPKPPEVAEEPREKPETATAPLARDAKPREEAKESGPAAQPEPPVQAAPKLQPEPQVAIKEPDAAPPTRREPQIAAKEPDAAASPSEEKAGGAETPAETEPQKTAASRPPLRQKRSIVVRRGDTLWHIAKRKYGSGTRYTAIYRDNRKQIRNPHWIYPGQEFSLPSPN